MNDHGVPNTSNNMIKFLIRMKSVAMAKQSHFLHLKIGERSINCTCILSSHPQWALWGDNVPRQ